MKLTHLSLFSGIGGLDLAAEWAGFETVGQCEWADYPTKVLEKHWPDVPRWRDIRGLTLDSFRTRTGLRTVDLISGGFPCQPFSVAGNQKGKEDDRYLWPEMLRVIRALTPRWVIGENVPGILRIAGRTVCEDLEREGYAVTVLNFEAAAVGAPHRRDRVFFVGWHTGGGKRQSQCAFTAISEQDAEPGRIRADVAHPNCERLQTGVESGGHGIQKSQPQDSRCSATGGSNRAKPGWWSTEPNVGRVAHGVPNRVDRLKCLGNAVVPQQAYPIFRAVAMAEQWAGEKEEP